MRSGLAGKRGRAPGRAGRAGRAGQAGRAGKRAGRRPPAFSHQTDSNFGCTDTELTWSPPLGLQTMHSQKFLQTRRGTRRMRRMRRTCVEHFSFWPIWLHGPETCGTPPRASQWTVTLCSLEVRCLEVQSLDHDAWPFQSGVDGPLQDDLPSKLCLRRAAVCISQVRTGGGMIGGR